MKICSDDHKQQSICKNFKAGSHKCKLDFSKSVLSRESDHHLRN